MELLSSIWYTTSSSRAVLTRPSFILSATTASTHHSYIFPPTPDNKPQILSSPNSFSGIEREFIFAHLAFGFREIFSLFIVLHHGIHAFNGRGRLIHVGHDEGGSRTRFVFCSFSSGSVLLGSSLECWRELQSKLIGIRWGKIQASPPCVEKCHSSCTRFGLRYGRYRLPHRLPHLVSALLASFDDSTTLQLNDTGHERSCGVGPVVHCTAAYYFSEI